MNEKLKERLAKLGLNEQNYNALVLLPLIQVAWADGKIQSSEKRLIMRIATENGLLDGGGQDVVSEWIENRPTDDELRLGARTLVSLARLAEEDQTASSVTIETLQDLLDFSHQVARAAGGMFGLAEPITRAELQCLTEVGAALQVHSGKTWLDLLD